jgi:hypothetical protein
MAGFKSGWASVVLSFAIFGQIKSQSVLDFSNYPSGARSCLDSAATASKCDTSTVAAFNSCVCENGGNFVTNAVQCLTSSDSGDLTAVYGTMASNCADSNTPLPFTLQQFLALAGSSSTTTPTKPITTTVTGVTTISQAGTTKVTTSTFVSTAQSSAQSSNAVTTIVITPTGSQTAPFTSVITMAATTGSAQSTQTPTASNNNGGGSKLSTPVIAGMSVGIALVLALIGLISAICWKQRRSERNNRNSRTELEAAPVTFVGGTPGTGPHSSVTTFNHSSPYDAAAMKAQQNRFSNMSYNPPVSSGHQSPVQRWSNQQQNIGSYHAPPGSEVPPTSNWTVQSDGGFSPNVAELPVQGPILQELPGQQPNMVHQQYPYHP